MHRPRYGDWSLPKGKLERDEDALVGAVREVLEETGHRVVVGQRLGTSAYDVVQDDVRTPKTVQWWAMRAAGGAFTVNDEVDELRWCSPGQALVLLTAGRDAEQLSRLAKAVDLRTAVLVRHAAAGDASRWDGPDDDRPLTPKGRRQAGQLVAELGGYGATRVLSAPPVRCVDTVRPLADHLGLPVEIEPMLGERAFARDPLACVAWLQALLATPGTPLVSSQGSALPGMLAGLAAEPPIVGTLQTRKGAAWVLSHRDGVLVSAERRPAPA